MHYSLPCERIVFELGGNVSILFCLDVGVQERVLNVLKNTKKSRITENVVKILDFRNKNNCRFCFISTWCFFNF